MALLPSVYSAALAADFQEAVSVWRKNTKVIDEQIEYYQRPFRYLLPSRVVSPQGDELSLTWERLAGQFLLKAIKSGPTSLFNATYTHDLVKFIVWPSTANEYTVSLALKDYLLSKLEWGKDNARQWVNYFYSSDPTLDKVLNWVEESDGSVERVRYDSQESGHKLPTVRWHTLVPGAGQAPVGTLYYFSEANYMNFVQLEKDRREELARLEIISKKDGEINQEVEELKRQLARGAVYDTYNIHARVECGY